MRFPMRLDWAASRALHAGLLALTVVAGAWLTLAELNLGRHGMVAVYVAQALDPYISVYLRVSLCISLHLPTSPYISLYLPISP